MAGALKQLAFLAAGVTLSGCAAGLGQWQSEQARAKAEFQHMRTEQQERDNYTACVNGGAMPGSAQNLQCQLEMAKKEQGAGKPQNPPDKAP